MFIEFLIRLKMFEKYFKIAIILIAMNSQAYRASAAGAAGENADAETAFIVDMPTAGVLSKGDYSIALRAVPNGGVFAAVSVSPLTNFSFGISYSGENIIGSDEPAFQGVPGVSAKWRVFDETVAFPAIAMGASNQGRGRFHSSAKRFDFMSPGVFVAASKNFRWALGFVATHAGVNYSFEPPFEERYPNFYLGFEHTIGPFASINLEFNAQTNDLDARFADKRGLLGASIRASLIRGITLEAVFKDLLRHSEAARGVSRSFGVEIIGSI